MFEETQQFKVGFSSTKDIDFNKCFADFKTGYAFYSKGQLRNDSDRHGRIYGENVFKKKITTITCHLNINKGIISFDINNKVYETAFEGSEIKNKSFYFVVGVAGKSKRVTIIN